MPRPKPRCQGRRHRHVSVESLLFEAVHCTAFIHGVRQHARADGIESDQTDYGSTTTENLARLPLLYRGACGRGSTRARAPKPWACHERASFTTHDVFCFLKKKNITSGIAPYENQSRCGAQSRTFHAKTVSTTRPSGVPTTQKETREK